MGPHKKSPGLIEAGAFIFPFEDQPFLLMNRSLASRE